MRAVKLRRPRIKTDRAASGVLAVESALRSAQYFDPFQVVKLQRLNGSDAFINFVDVNGDRALLVHCIVRHGDAADNERRLHLTKGGGKRNVRELPAKLGHICDLRPGELITG